MNHIINQVTDKKVREALLLMANNLLSGKSELAQKSVLQNICYNLHEWLTVQERYTSKDSILVKKPSFNQRKNSGDSYEKKTNFLVIC